MNARHITLLLALLCAGPLPLVGATEIALGATTPPIPAIAGQFDLETLDGREVTDADYRGKWLLIYFGYTYCPDVCPTVLNEIGTALNDLGPAAAKVQPIFITIDPARDKAPVMKAYLKSFDPRIVGLRGDATKSKPRPKRSMSITSRVRSAMDNIPSITADFCI